MRLTTVVVALALLSALAAAADPPAGRTGVENATGNAIVIPFDQRVRQGARIEIIARDSGARFAVIVDELDDFGGWLKLETTDLATGNARAFQLGPID